MNTQEVDHKIYRRQTENGRAKIDLIILKESISLKQKLLFHWQYNLNKIQKYLLCSSLLLVVVVYFFGFTFFGFDTEFFIILHWICAFYFLAVSANNIVINFHVGDPYEILQFEGNKLRIGTHLFDADKINTVAISQDESKAYFSLPDCDNLELTPVFSFDKGYYLSVVNYIKHGLPKATIIE